MNTKTRIRERLSKATFSVADRHHLSVEQLEKIITNAYEAIQITVNRQSDNKEMNSLRKLFVSKSYTEYNDPLINEITEECVRRSQGSVQLPILLTRKISEKVVRAELTEINKLFSCNSLSKLLKYFGITRSLNANKYIYQNTA